MRLQGSSRGRVINNCRGHLLRLVVFAPIGLCGCAATVSTGPARVFSVEEDAAVLKAQFALPDLTRPYLETDRNNFITARMYAIDIEFTEYFSRLTIERQLGTFGGDLALLGLTAATTVTHGAALKTALAAVSTAVAGARTAVDKDILVSQTIQVLQSQMEASRLAIRNRILANLALPIAAYPLPMGLSDLEDYYRAGTLAGALESLSSVIGNNSQVNKNLTNGVTQNGIPVNAVSRTGTSSAQPQMGTTSAGAGVLGVAPR
jgi:hypothetical protein